MRELALFAGAGGGILGGRLLGWRTVCAVELDAYCRSVLLARQRDGMLPRFPIWDDVRTFNGRPWRGSVDVISGGFPCQDISIAGKGAGIDGERSGLWSEFARIIGEVRPRYAYIENSPRLTVLGLDQVLCDLAQMGLNAEWGCLGADDAGGHFVGERIWILAESPAPCSSGRQGEWAVEMGKNQWGRDEFERLVRLEVEHGVPAGSFGRVSDGIPRRMDRLRACGNAQVPAVAALAWRVLAERLP